MGDGGRVVVFTQFPPGPTNRLSFSHYLLALFPQPQGRREGKIYIFIRQGDQKEKRRLTESARGGKKVKKFHI